VTTLALYEDLLAPGECRSLPAANRVLFVASGEASSLGPNEAWFGDGEARVRAGHEGATVLRWELTDWEPEGAKVAARIELDPWSDYLMRCERVELRAGSSAAGQAGPGIRCLLSGALRLAGRSASTLSPLDAWYEEAHTAETTATEAGAALVRVVVVPPDAPRDAESGERTTVLVEEPIRL
jgi:hypothetical protein